MGQSKNVFLKYKVVILSLIIISLLVIVSIFMLFPKNGTTNKAVEKSKTTESISTFNKNESGSVESQNKISEANDSKDSITSPEQNTTTDSSTKLLSDANSVLKERSVSISATKILVQSGDWFATDAVVSGGQSGTAIFHIVNEKATIYSMGTGFVATDLQSGGVPEAIIKAVIG